MCLCKTDTKWVCGNKLYIDKNIIKIRWIYSMVILSNKMLFHTIKSKLPWQSRQIFNLVSFVWFLLLMLLPSHPQRLSGPLYIWFLDRHYCSTLLKFHDGPDISVLKAYQWHLQTYSHFTTSFHIRSNLLQKLIL